MCARLGGLAFGLYKTIMPLTIVPTTRVKRSLPVADARHYKFIVASNGRSEESCRNRPVNRSQATSFPHFSGKHTTKHESLKICVDQITTYLIAVARWNFESGTPIDRSGVRSKEAGHGNQHKLRAS